MRRCAFAAIIFVPLLSACGGGGGSTANAIPQTITAPLGSRQALAIQNEAQSDATQTRQPLYTPSTADLLYVGNTGNNSITVYRHDASGDTAPIRVIAGSKTQLSAPGQLSEDAAGNLYVANGFNEGISAKPAILVFAHGANGNVAPIRKLAGNLTGIESVTGMTVDQATGKIFVLDEGPSEGESRLLRFPPNATGNEAPFAGTTFELGPASQLANDSTGKNIIESYSPVCCEAANVGVHVLAKQFSNNTYPIIQYGITRFAAIGVADDPASKTYVVSGTDGIRSGIFRFAEDTVGNGTLAPDGSIPEHFQPALKSVITSAADCGQLAVGYLRNTYAVCGSSVKVFTDDASGNASPLRVLRGSGTKLDEPYGIYEGR